MKIVKGNYTVSDFGREMTGIYISCAGADILDGGICY